jgi:hypothetical protein
MNKSDAILGRDLNPAEWEQAAIVQADVLELMKHLVREGIDYRIVAAGTSSAIADMIGLINGWAAVPQHFALMAMLTHHLGSLD